MNAKLIVVGGTTSTTEVKLRLPAIIGRGRSVQVTIPHSLVSRQHCEISEADGRLLVRDLGSMNGTYIGDERITEAILEPGALLTVGTVTFRAIYEVNSDDDSRSDDSDDTCLGDDTKAVADDPSGTDKQQIADGETIPVGPATFSKAVLPPRLPENDEASDETATEPITDRANQPALESSAKNTD